MGCTGILPPPLPPPLKLNQAFMKDVTDGIDIIATYAFLLLSRHQLLS